VVFLVGLLLVVACNCVNFDNADLLKMDLALSIEQKCGGLLACLHYKLLNQESFEFEHLVVCSPG
jgi:hypothetical protein